jgi:hypothetical protein
MLNNLILKLTSNQRIRSQNDSVPICFVRPVCATGARNGDSEVAAVIGCGPRFVILMDRFMPNW